MYDIELVDIIRIVENYNRAMDKQCKDFEYNMEMFSKDNDILITNFLDSQGQLALVKASINDFFKKATKFLYEFDDYIVSNRVIKFVNVYSVIKKNQETLLNFVRAHDFPFKTMPDVFNAIGNKIESFALQSPPPKGRGLFRKGQLTG
jgi:hypothetical protein